MSRSRWGTRAARRSNAAASGRSCIRGRWSPWRPARSRGGAACATGHGGSGVGKQLGVEGQDADPANRPAVDDHPVAEVGRSAPLGVDALAAANVLAQGGHHAQVGRQPIGVLVGHAAADHDEVDAFGQGLVAQGGELDELGPERLESLEGVGEIAAEGFVLGVGDAEAPAALGDAAGTRIVHRVREGAAAGQVVDRIQVAVAEEMLSQAP